LKQQAFTVNIPSESFVKEADFAGIFSGKDMDKFQACGLTPVKAEQVDAPYIKEFPMVLICKLIHTFEIGVHTQFIGEIIDVLVEENCLNEQNKPILEKIKPFIYDSSESAYYTVGKKIMQAYTTKAISKK
jgi:flavin reductase (DIM6/NTAB) family NADH-FMN oxidoreductase RutF